MRYSLAMAATAIALAGCSTNDVPASEKAITAFHQQVEAGQFDQIYDASTQDIKGTTSKAAFNQLLTAIHGKLGAYKTGSMASWNDNYGTGGHVLTAIYNATYANGPAQETFVYRIDGDRAILAGYHVNSNALLLH